MNQNPPGIAKFGAAAFLQPTMAAFLQHEGTMTAFSQPTMTAFLRQ